MRRHRQHAQTGEQLRNALLWFDSDIAAQRLNVSDLRGHEVLTECISGAVPPLPLRLVQDLARKRGQLDFERAVAAPLQRLRKRLLADRAAPAPPRFLIRVDEFPHYRADEDAQRFGNEEFARFDALMEQAGVPYLLAVLPRVSDDPLDPEKDDSRALSDAERRLLRSLDPSRVALAVHGLDHRTRHASPRRHSELIGLSDADLRERLDRATTEFVGLTPQAPKIFVAPYNRFSAAQLPILAEHYEIVCGGPECVRQLGFHATPQWREGALYVPAYAPLYGRAEEVLPCAERLIAAQTPIWAPIVLHWEWEAENGWTQLQRLLERIAPYCVPWEELRDAAARAKAADA